MPLYGFCLENERKQKDRQILGPCHKTKKLRSIRVNVVPIVVRALGRVSKSLEKGLEKLVISGRIENIWFIALLKSARILRIVRKTQEDCSERRTAHAGGKNSQGENNNNNNDNNNNNNNTKREDRIHNSVTRQRVKLANHYITTRCTSLGLVLTFIILCLVWQKTKRMGYPVRSELTNNHLLT